MRPVRPLEGPEVSDRFREWYVSEDPVPLGLVDELVASVLTKHPGVVITKVIVKSGLDCDEDCFVDARHSHVFVRWTPAYLLATGELALEAL